MSLKAGAVFLTFSQVENRERSNLITFLSSIPFVLGGIVCTERHQDGGKHFHAYLDLKPGSRFENTRFDFDNVHPNVVCIKGAKTLPAHTNRITYVKKDGDFELFPEGYEFKSEKRDIWKEVRLAETRGAALTLIAENKPRDYIINRRQIDYALDAMFPTQRSEYIPDFNRSSFNNVPEILNDFVLENFGRSNFSQFL